jgi:hypothetical protein
MDADFFCGFLEEESDAFQFAGLYFFQDFSKITSEASFLPVSF